MPDSNSDMDSKQRSPAGPIVVDGRVFASEAADRGMGRYVDYLIELLVLAGRDVRVMASDKATSLPQQRPKVAIDVVAASDDPLEYTERLNRYLGDVSAAAFLDGTPFIAPVRYDILRVPVLAVLFDLIPMRYPADYLQGGALPVYVNGVARVQKADHLIAISATTRTHAIRYLGIPGEQVSVIEPRVGERYESYRETAPRRDPSMRSITCIQGAHRSKNFPAAVTFLERLSGRSGRTVDLIVPTQSQRALVDRARDSTVKDVRVHHALAEDEKFRLQQDAVVCAHLSLDEGYGIPFAEALFVGCPVIAIDNEINREILGSCGDPAAAGVLLLRDHALRNDATVDDAAQFVRACADRRAIAGRGAVLDEIRARYDQAPATLDQAIAKASRHSRDWHSQLAPGVVMPTEFGSCGVSDYCLSLLRGDPRPRYAFLLGSAPEELQLLKGVRLLPRALLGNARDLVPGVVFNLAVSASLVRAFDDINSNSRSGDTLIVHDAGSYLPGLLMLAAAARDYEPLFATYLHDEPADVRALSATWLGNAGREPKLSQQLFQEIDRQFLSTWLAHFRGRLVSHHRAFQLPADGSKAQGSEILEQLSESSEIRLRTRFAPMPIDRRAYAGVARFAQKVRWGLGLARHDLLVCCAGSVVAGKYLQSVARAIAGLDADLRAEGASERLVLMLAGRVLDPALLQSMRDEFDRQGCPDRLVNLVESSEIRYDAMLAASDIVVAFREQRRIQMSHSYVRALALGRPTITNRGSGFAEEGDPLLCRDDNLEADLVERLRALIGAPARCGEMAAESQQRYLHSHRVSAFFATIEAPNG
jgi:glycosyltransferase involved in cell wall biosynthesis